MSKCLGENVTPGIVRVMAMGWIVCHTMHVRVGARCGVAAVVVAMGLVR